jgi:hypothetical protein
MTQVAKLFLRGKLITQLRDFSQEQREELDIYTEDVFSDPILDNAKHEFCNALRRTIGNEYCNKEVALVDYRISIMRAVIAAVHGWGSHDPVPDVFIDKKQKKKFFQTWVFQYLKQILRENKRPTIKKKQNGSILIEEAIVIDIEDALKELASNNPKHKKLYSDAISDLHVEEDRVYINHWMFPPEFINSIAAIKNKYLNYKVEIILKDTHIVVKPHEVIYVQIDRKDESFVKFTNFEQNNSENDNFYNYTLEFEASKMKPQAPVTDYKDNESITEMMKALPEDAKEVIKIILDPPDEYINQYGFKHHKSHMATFLGVTNKEIGRRMKILKVHMMANGIGM